MRALAILPVVLAGCLDESTGARAVVGSPEDVTTPAGTYDGYAVVYPCPDGHRDLGVHGLGAVEIEDVDAISELGNALWLDLQGIESVWGGGGAGLGCEPGVGTTVFLDDWRDVDTVIERAAAFLVERGLALEVGITVESVPVAH